MFKSIIKEKDKFNTGRKIRLYFRTKSQGNVLAVYLTYSSKKNGQEKRKLDVEFHAEDSLGEQKSKLRLVQKICTTYELEYLESSIGFTLKDKKQKDLNLFAEMQFWSETKFKGSQTHKNSLTAINKLREIIGDNPKSKNQMKKADIEDIKDKLLDSELGNNTARTYLNVLKRFFSYQKKIEAISYNPCENVSIKEVEKEITYLNPLEREEVFNVQVDDVRGFFSKIHSFSNSVGEKRKYSFLRNLKEDVFKEVMEGLLVSCYTGLRPSDLQRLTVRCIKDGYIYMNTQKTNSNVTIPIAKEIETIIAHRIKKSVPNDLLFQLPRSMDKSRVLWGVSQFLGYDFTLEFRMGRRTFACMLAQEGVPSMVIAKLMGHKKSIMTEKYYAVVNQEGLDEAVLNLPSLKEVASS